MRRVKATVEESWMDPDDDEEMDDEDEAGAEAAEGS